MMIKLRIEKGDVMLYEQNYDISDAESFGKACAHAWSQLRGQRLDRATSVGALFERLNDPLIDELDGITISLAKT